MSHYYFVDSPNFHSMDKESLQKVFGANVKRIREGQGMTQLQLAVKADTDIRQVQRIEAGEIATSIAQAKLIADVLGAGLDELVG